MDPLDHQSSSSTSDEENQYEEEEEEEEQKDSNTKDQNEETPNESQTNSSTTESTDEHQGENPLLSPEDQQEEKEEEEEEEETNEEDESPEDEIKSDSSSQNETSPESKEEKNNKNEDEDDVLLSSPDEEKSETKAEESLEPNDPKKDETNENEESTNESSSNSSPNERIEVEESTEDEQKDSMNKHVDVIDDDDDDPFHLPSKTNFETSEEIKSQRVLDEEEIPPATPVLLLQSSSSSSSRKNSFSNEKRLSQSSQPIVSNDDEEKENDDPKKTDDQIDSKEDKEEFNLQQSILPPLESTSIAQELIHDRDIDHNDLHEEKPNIDEDISTNDQIEFPWEDILSNHSLMKQIIRKGRTNSRPSRSQLVTVNYSLSRIDKETSEEILIEEMINEQFFVGESDIIAAIDYSIQSMEEGELSLIHSDLRHCYGKEDLIEKDFPTTKQIKDYQIKIQLELVQYLPAPNVELLSAAERSFWAEKKRQNGNNFYRRKDYSTSLQCYRGSLRFLDFENNPLRTETNEDDRKKLVDQYIQVQNNVAQVNLNLKRYDLCLNAVENVLKIDPKNSKALFRQGKSFFELGFYDKCRIPLKTLLQVDSNNPDKDQILSMISISDQKLADYQKNEKEIYRRMFPSSSSTSTSPSSTTTTTTINSSKTKNRRNIVVKKSNSTSFWTYLGFAGVTFSAIALFTLFKYRKTS